MFALESDTKNDEFYLFLLWFVFLLPSDLAYGHMPLRTTSFYFEILKGTERYGGFLSLTQSCC